MKILLILLSVLISFTLYADELEFDFEVIKPNSIESHHSYHCHPNCMNQKNGGYGYQIDIGPTGFGESHFTNSFGNPGWMIYVVLYRYRLQNNLLRGEVEIILSEVHGYDDIVVFPWPKFEVGINPFFKFTDKFFINFNEMVFPAIMGSHATVEIKWFSFGYYTKF
jgi:hypothetical protein